MRKKKRGTINLQVMRPLVLFIIVLILSNGIFLFLYNLNKNINERYNTASSFGMAVATQVSSYRGLEFLIPYWQEHSGDMELFYNDEAKLIRKEKYIFSVLPGVTDISQITNDQARELSSEAQQYYAEVAYVRLCKIFDSFKRSYKPMYLYDFVVKDNNIVFLITGTLVNEKRESEGGDIFDVGKELPYNVGTYPVLDKLLETRRPVQEMEMSLGNSADNSAVHAFSPVYSNGRIVSIVAVSLEWQDIIMSSLRPAIVVTSVSAGLFLLLGISIYILLKKSVTGPVAKEQEIIHKYEGDKDSEEAVRLLNLITSDNEIESLAESFSSMVGELNRYIEEVRDVTSAKERIEAELSMATEIQASQLPDKFPERDDFEIFASMNPAKEVGGDFYDFFMIDKDHLGLVIADVTGKGVPAALFMMISKILIKNHLQNNESPEEALNKVNKQLLENNKAGLFVTAWVAKIDLNTGDCLICNAGHEHPALKRAGGKFELIKYRHAPPVAVDEDFMFKEHPFKLEPGDYIYVYTDGVTEATDKDNELFGTDRMIDALNVNPDSNPKIILNTVAKHINDFVAEAPQFDDITMLGFRFNGRQNED